MFYIIQENLFKEHHYQTLLNTMERFKFEYDIVKYIPFAGDIYQWYDAEETDKIPDFEPTIYQTDKTNIFCFGAVSMATAAAKRGWKPGSMLNDNHDYNVYAPKFGFENMLNGDGKVISFIDPVPFDDEYFFVRPTKDSKVFTGQVFSKTAWEDYTKTVNTITEETQVLVSPVKNIQQEVRCWVVGGKVVTASRYKISNRVIYANYDDETFFTDFAQKMVDKFQVAEAFVIDVCLANDELKVVEVNNINSAGFYECNITKLIMALENHFSNI